MSKKERLLRNLKGEKNRIDPRIKAKKFKANKNFFNSSGN